MVVRSLRRTLYTPVDTSYSMDDLPKIHTGHRNHPPVVALLCLCFGSICKGFSAHSIANALMGGNRDCTYRAQFVLRIPLDE